MRQVSIKGLEDGVCKDLGSDVGLLSDVMDKGVGVDYLIYKWTADGKTVKAFLKAHHIDAEYLSDEKRYELTAYDW